MMTDEQKSKVAELKAAIAASAPTAGGAPQEVRVAALALKDGAAPVGHHGARTRRGAGRSRDHAVSVGAGGRSGRAPSVSAKREERTWREASAWCR